MYPHHMESIGRLLEYFKMDSGVIAVIIGRHASIFRSSNIRLQSERKLRSFRRKGQNENGCS